MRLPRKVYAIRHNVTNRVYIGSSCRADHRFKSHLYALRRHGHPIEDMQADFDQYGEDYTFTILDEIFEYKDRFKEYEWMKKYQSHIRGIGYNYKDHILKQITSPKAKMLVTFNGKSMPIQDWSRETGIPYSVIRGRIYKCHWSVEKALTTPCKKYLTPDEIRRLVCNEPN